MFALLSVVTDTWFAFAVGCNACAHPIAHLTGGSLLMKGALRSNKHIQEGYVHSPGSRLTTVE
ncbi:hypothetical protein BCAR13_440105 [Paraburkholderia caribensis]|nr:hypothetical protein BCAR13_440105 [Paraburkholderia caribensis]